MNALSGNVSGSATEAESWTAAISVMDMPQDRSFLLTPLEPIDPVREQPNDCLRQLRSPGISPTPQKSLFEMGSEDLRAAEQAWLQAVGSFKLNNIHVLRSTKAPGDISPSQKELGCCSATEDQTCIPSDLHEPYSMPISGEQLPDSGTKMGDQRTIQACRELTDKLKVASEKEPLLTVAEEESASRSRHSSMSLRQRFSMLMAARRSGNGTYESIPSRELSPAQGLGAAIPDVGHNAAAPRVAMVDPLTEQPASASLPADRNAVDCSTTADTPANGTEAVPAVSPGQPDPASVSADALGEHDDLSQPHPLAAAVDTLENFDRTLNSVHMQQTPFMRLASIRRPSAARRRPSQLLQAPAEMLQFFADSCSTQPAAPSSEGLGNIETALGQIQGDTARMDISASAGQVGGPQRPKHPEEPSHDTPALTHSSTGLEQAAETESYDSNIDFPGLGEAMQEERETPAGNPADLGGQTLSSPCTADSEQYEVPAEPPNATAESFSSLAYASSKPSRSRVPHAALGADPSDACSLESACPSFANRLAHPAWHAHRNSTSTGTTGMQQVKKKPMLRGRNAEECGVRMYERARAAQHVRQTR